MDTVVKFVAGYLIYIIIFSFLIKLYVLGDRQNKVKLLVLIVSSILISIALNIAFGTLFNNPRPFVVDGTTPLIAHRADNGFPSNHATAVFLMAAIVWLYDKRFSFYLILLGSLVGAARVIANIHHTIDIIGGALIAIVAVTIASRLTHVIFSRYHRGID